MSACMYVHHIHVVSGNQKRILLTLEVKLQVVVHHQMYLLDQGLLQEQQLLFTVKFISHEC